MIIGIMGAAGAGKSTLANILVQEYGFQRESMASPLKAMLEAIGVPDSGLYGSPADKEAPQDVLCGKSSRYAMQTLGTEWGRKLIGDDIWVNAMKIRINSVRPGNIVIDDIRFKNEVDMVRGLGGIIVTVYRSAVDIKLVGHSSEELWGDVIPDYKVINNNGLDGLRNYSIELAEYVNHLIACRNYTRSY